MKSKIKTGRMHIVMPEWLIEAVKAKADNKGVSQSDYIRDLLKADLIRKADAD